MKHLSAAIMLLLVTTVAYSQVAFDFSTPQKLDSLVTQECVLTNMQAENGKLATGYLTAGSAFYIETGLMDFLPETKPKQWKLRVGYFVDGVTGSDSIALHTVLIDINGNADTITRFGFLNSSPYLSEVMQVYSMTVAKPGFTAGQYKIRLVFVGNTQNVRALLNRFKLEGPVNYIGGCSTLQLRYRAGSFKVRKRI